METKSLSKTIFITRVDTTITTTDILTMDIMLIMMVITRVFTTATTKAIITATTIATTTAIIAATTTATIMGIMLIWVITMSMDMTKLCTKEYRILAPPRTGIRLQMESLYETFDKDFYSQVVTAFSGAEKMRSLGIASGA